MLSLLSYITQDHQPRVALLTVDWALLNHQHQENASGKQWSWPWWCNCGRTSPKGKRAGELALLLAACYIESASQGNAVELTLVVFVDVERLAG